MGWPVVIAANGRGIPVTESPNGTPYEISANGYGTPVVFVDQGGLPVSSVLPVWAAGASQAWDFTASRYYNSAATPTDTHAGTINADDAAGAWSAFAPDVLVRTTRGVQTIPGYSQYATNPTAPANQTITLATTGTYTLWIEGPGSVAVAAGTAVGTGFGSASAGVPVVFAISTGGTVNLTVTGAPTLVQVINKGFVLPPIYSVSSLVGNRPVITGLGTQLAGGVYGFVQVDIRGVNAAAFPRIITLYGATDGSHRATVRYSGGQVIIDVVDGGAVQAAGAGAAGTYATGLATYAFAAGTNFFKIRKVGGADTVADELGSYPVLSTLAFGGNGSSAAVNGYQNTKLLALWYGQPDASKFDAVFAKATLAHAAAA